MNRPTPVKTDNFFLLLFNALRQRRVPLALRIASQNVMLVALALVIYAVVMGLQFKQAMNQQADALGQSLVTQTATSASNLLVSNDIISLSVLLNNLVKNPLVAHAAIYNVDSRIVAEAGQRPSQGLLAENTGMYTSELKFQDTAAGSLRISLNMQQFRQPMTISLQSMGILSLILLVISLTMSLRLGRYISTPLLQLRVWLRDPDEHTPALQRNDEIGDLARQLDARLAPERVEPEPEFEEDLGDFDDDLIDDEDGIPPTLHQRANAVTLDKPVSKLTANLADDLDDEDDPFADLRDDSAVIDQPAPKPVVVTPQMPSTPQRSAILAVQLGAQEQLRRLPRNRLMELLKRYRDCLDQAASLYECKLHTLNDGSSLLLFHSQNSGEDFLTNALCCGELLRALGHALQIEVADSGITLQLQLGLTLSPNLLNISQSDLLLNEKAQNALAMSQHSRNLLLVERRISEEPLVRIRARIRSIASPEGASCVERLVEPYPSLIERQLVRMQESQQPTV